MKQSCPFEFIGANMIRFFIPIAVIALVCGLVSIRLKKPFGLICPFSIMLAVLIVYLSGVVTGSFVAGYMILSGAFVVLIALLIYDVVRSRASVAEAVRSYCFTGGGFAYLIFAGLCFLIARMHGSDLVYWDEFAHWGQMAKELFRLDAFYTVDQTTLLYHNDYPPAIPLWEAMCAKMAGQWDGRYMYASLWLLQCATFLPLIDAVGKKSKRFATAGITVANILLFCVLFVPCFDNGTASFWLSIYIDTVLALLFGLGLYLAFQPRKSNFLWFSLGILLCFLVLVKQSSLFFIGCIVIALMVSVIFLAPKADRHRSLVRCAVLVVACVAFYLSWKLVLSTSTVPSAQGQFSIPLSGALSVPAILFGGGSDVQQEVVALYGQALLGKPIAPYLWLDVSYVGASLLLVAMTLAACMLFKVRIRTAVCIAGFQLFAAALYAVFMLVMYLFSFSETDGLNLVCFERYMNTGLVGLYMASFMLFLQRTYDGGGRFDFAPSILVAAFCAMLMVSPGAMAQIRTEDNKSAKEFSNDASLLEAALPENSSVFIVNEGGNPFETLEIAYYADGIKISREVEGGLFSVADLSWEATPAQMMEMLSDEDYLYVKSIDQAFVDRYQSIFSESLENGAIYSIDAVGDESISVTKVENSDN